MKRGKTKNSAPAPAKSFSVKLAWFAVVLVLLLFAGIRLRLLDVPLERDEGEYAYAGQLMLQGIPPYKLAYNMKLPGTYAAYAAIMAVFGETTRGIHLGLILVNAATSLLIFLLAKKLFDVKSAVVACASFALLSASSSVLGLAAHANHFVILCALGGFWFLWRKEEKSIWHFYQAGFLLGLAFVMKQQGVLFCAYGCLWLLISELWARPIEWKRLLSRNGLLLAGMLTPFALTCLILWGAGIFEKFWFWTFAYARAYATAVAWRDALVILKDVSPIVLESNHGLWILAGLGLLLLPFARKWRPQIFWLAGFVLFSILAVCPGFYFRQQYFILLLPALALLIGVMVGIGSDWLAEKRVPGFVKVLPILVFIAVFVFGVFKQRAYFFQLRPIDVSVNAYSNNPFIEAVEIGDYIREHTKPDAKIAVIGSEPQIYFYARRHSATGYIYTYPLMEEQPYAKTMQEEMIREIEAANPEYLVMVGFPYSWVTYPKSDRSIFNWYDSFKTNYVSIGVGDFLSIEERDIRWDAEQAGDVQTKFFLQIWRRR